MNKDNETRIKHRKKQYRALAWLTLTLSLCAMALFGYQYWLIQQTVLEADGSYEELINSVRPGGVSDFVVRQAYEAGDQNHQQAVNGVFAENSAVGEENNKQAAADRIGSSAAGVESNAQSVISQSSNGETQNIHAPLGDVSSNATSLNAAPLNAPSSYVPAAFNSQSGILNSAPKATIMIPNLTINFTALQAINPDAAAWLYCPDTLIDYPVMKATDYDYYLRHLPDGTLNANGALFIDYNWTGYSDELMVIYGHNMKSGRMFGALTKYKEQSYFKAHPYLYLYTADGGKHRIDLLYGCVIGAGQWRERAFMFKENLDALLDYSAHHTTFTSEAAYEKGDQIVVLSTCSYEFDDARYVVVGVMR